MMSAVYHITVIAIFINFGYSLNNRLNQLPSEERYSFFDAELFQAFNQKEEKNLLVSPISIKLVLGMLMEGAEGKTADEIRSALRLSEDKEEARKEFDTWLSVLQTKGSQTLKIADRVFLSDRLTVNPTYSNTLLKHFGAGVASVKFENAKEASQVINNWVSNETSHMIPKVVEEKQIKPDIQMMLASAVYFKGIWSTPFNKERTALRCFYSKSGECEEIVMMMVTGFFDYGYISQLDATAISLPYQGNGFSMLLLLPRKNNGVQQLSRDLLHVSMKSIKSEMVHQEVFLQLPKFEISHKEDLVETLKKLEISQVFTPHANLSNILQKKSNSTSASHVFHFSKLTIDEDGSEAAAATGAFFVPLMGGTTTSFIANHPFLFFILDSSKNSILFAGKIYSPKAPVDPMAVEESRKVSVIKSSAKETSSKKDVVKSAESFFTEIHGPKFRSINVTSIISSSSSSQKNNSLNSTFRKSLDSTQTSFSSQFSSGENKTKKRRKLAAEEPKSKNRKRQNDEWRHHILYFT